MKLIQSKYLKNINYQMGYYRGIYMSAFLLRRNLKKLSKLSTEKLINFLDMLTKHDLKFSDIKVNKMLRGVREDGN